MDFQDHCSKLRESLKPFEEEFNNLRLIAIDTRVEDSHRHGEMCANVTLALRHLEDCRMRLGKAIQAFNGGVSVYPR
jgi:hypothetical protein